MALDIASVLAEGQQLLDKQKQQGVDLGELLGVARSANAAVVPAITAKGEADMAVEQATQDRLKKQDEELALIRQQSGVIGAAGRHAQITQEIAAMDAQLAPMRASLMQRMQTSIADDPLGWLLNQFTLPGEIAAYNNMWEGRQGLHQALQTDIATSTQAAQFAKQTMGQTSDAEATARLTQIAAATDVAAKQAAAETAQRSINLLVEQARFERLPYETAKDQLSIKMQAENLRLAQAREDRDKIKDEKDKRLYELKVERATLELEKARKSVADEKEFEKKLVLATAALNLPPMNIAEFEAMQRSRPVTADAVLSAVSQIDLSKPMDEQFVSFGPDLATSLQFLRDRGIQLGGGKAEVIKMAETYINNQANRYDRANPGQKFKQLTKEQQDGLRRTWSREFEQNYADPNTPGSIYNSMTVQGLAATKQGQLDLSKTQIVRTLQKKYEANPAQQIGTEEIIGTAVGLAASAKTAGDMERLSKEIAYIFQARRNEAYMHLEPQRVGMTLPDKVVYTYDPGLYSLPSQGTGIFPGLGEASRPVDLTNPTEVKNMLLLEKAKEKLREAALSGPKSLFGASQLPTAQPAPAVQRGAAVLFGGRYALDQGNQ